MSQRVGDLPHLVIRGARGEPRTHKVVNYVQGISTTYEYNTHTPNFPNLARGIYERLLFVKVDGKFQPAPKPVAGVFSTRLATFADALVKNCSFTNPITLREFPELFTARRKTVYVNAVQSLEVYPVLKEDAVCKTFTKVEKINFTAKPDAVPRIIQPRNPRYNVCVGRFIKKMECNIIKAIARTYKIPTVVKGMNADEVGQLAYRKWCGFKHPVAVSMDASRFDQHVSRQALEWEHSIYARLVAHPHDREELRRLLRWQLTNYGKTFIENKKVKYGVDGCRMSGDMNTGLGNCLLSCAMLYAYGLEHNLNFQLLNNGDDCLLFLEETDLFKLDSIPEYFKDMGFNMIVEKPEYDLEKVSFCQSNFFKINGQYRMVREPKTALAKDSVSIKPLKDFNEMRAWMRAVGEGGQALCDSVPVMSAFYNCYVRNSAGVKALNSNDPSLQTGTRMLAKGMIHTAAKPDDYSRYSFWLGTGIFPDEQLALEDYYNKLAIYGTETSADNIPLQLLH